MTRRSPLLLLVPVALVACGAYLSAQTLLPSTPPKGFGASVTPAYEGWFDNADGTHSFLIGYFNRNAKTEVDAPIGPANHFEPGSADMGQPTHFLPGRRYGMFIYTVPKDWGAKQKLTWYLTVNGVTTSVPFYMSPDYNITPLRGSEEGPTGNYNLPPTLRFEEHGTSFSGPLANPVRAIARTGMVGVPMPLNIWTDDDAEYASGTNAPLTGNRPPVDLVFSKYRGPGEVKFDGKVKLEALKGGKPLEPYSGKGATSATFSEAGDYMLHITVNDYSGNGGGGAACCWTTALIKVNVKDGGPATTGQ